MGLKSQPLLILTMLTLVTASAFAYELQTTGESGARLRWPGATVELAVSESFDESSNIRGADQAYEAIARAARAWSSVAGIEIVLSRSKELSVSPPGRRGDGVSLITIAQTPENLLLFTGPNSGRPAVTRLFFDKKGRILEADIVLNPYFSTSTDGSLGSFDLESTLVHELGHAIGLGHSAVFGASMRTNVARNGLYSLPFTSARTLSRDDIAGARALYGPDDSDGACCGSLSGSVGRAPGDESEVFVWLEEKETGAVGSMTRANDSGEFRIDGLEPGAYHVYSRDAAHGAAYLGQIEVKKDVNSELMSKAGSTAGRSLLSGVGFNGQLSTIAVPVNAGRSFKIYVSGTGVLTDLELGISAPGIEVDLSSIEFPDYGKEVSVTAFVVDVEGSVPEGEYTLRLFRDGELVDCIVGAITVERLPNPWSHREP
ncbi:MAG: matrixin family metalloprotease [Aridibacter famidurans]|nr:matrixin family metalloprotease [Aridibacter famidurans]